MPTAWDSDTCYGAHQDANGKLPDGWRPHRKAAALAAAQIRGRAKRLASFNVDLLVLYNAMMSLL